MTINDPSLSNQDLRPTTAAQRTWTMYNYIALWFSMSMEITTYQLASSLIAKGMDWKQAVGTVLLGNLIVLIPMLLNAHAGAKYGIPFPVFIRAPFGVRGANLPAILRAVVACGWFGIQSWIGGQAIDSMLAVIESHGPGATKAELAEALRREETMRGLTFDYCLIAAGSSLNRAPSDRRWENGDVLSLDSGGNYHGYIGDLARMGIAGEPDAELVDLLAEVEAIEQACMKPIKAGALGQEIYAAADAVLHKSKLHNHIEFLAHGMGLVSHEAPRLTNSGPVPYDDYDAKRPLEAGMVISVETTLLHPRRGFIKLEDTVAVTPTGFEVYGDRARGWNRAGGTA